MRAVSLAVAGRCEFDTRSVSKRKSRDSRARSLALTPSLGARALVSVRSRIAPPVRAHRALV